MSSEGNSRKKPTKGYLVPSRYKQAAKSASQSSSREKSPQYRGCSPQRSEKVMMQSTLRSIGLESSRYGSSKKFTSTPAVQGQHALPSIDASAISDESGFLLVPKRNARNATNSAGQEQTFLKNKTRSLTSKGPPHSSQKAASEVNLPNTLSTAELNILYAEYLQAKLLESNAKEAAQKRSKYASEQIRQIWALMKVLMVKNEKVYRELQLISYLNKMHKHLSAQEEMLLPIIEIIPEFENQYESIAKAVDTVRHKLEIKNMSLAGCGSEDEIIDLLLKISDLIKTLKCEHNADEIIIGAGVSDSFLQQGNLVASEINRGKNLLSEANDLLLDETMLKLALTN